jgi:hypothetical protein
LRTPAVRFGGGNLEGIESFTMPEQVSDMATIRQCARSAALWRETRYAAPVGKTRVSLSLVLPVVELTVWAVLIPAQIVQIWYGAHQASRRSQGAIARVGEIELRMPPEQWLRFTLRWQPLKYSHAIIATNLPGLAADALISLPTGQPGKWHPAAVSLDNWRGLVLPFYCLPAWWLAGLGIDGLLGRKEIRPAILWIGSILCFLFAVTLFGYYTSTAADQADLRWVLPGSWLWTILLATIPFDWILQKKRSERTANA